VLDTDTKRRIDTARDILVGKVPDPKSQVEQITIALIYKFMDDMDAESEELGGKRKFFTGDFARYGWAKLMDRSLGGHEMLGLYGEGIAKMPENPGIPALFRDIFKNAYLPYRDPETLKAFLKIIDEFSYDHSERLGDAFEYLLSVLGSQGDAGQFRTPRHIIDFMVEVLAPQKGETILDPACGTAGFLISAYKHILRTNTDAKGNSTLTPDEKGRLARNFKGFDISPDMVRLSLVNLYLHGFTDPHIFEYDTLTSDERWNEFADVILANPPFMSPKGGIKPHRRFSIQAKRSEVLFVDYMAEHLTPGGRAAIIVPEGIIFQSQTAYKELRKMLVDNSLVAVVSLPAGCFNPYSGVKTSILILDKTLAKAADTIAFFKVENDGFGLGAQRRAIDKNDLPQVQAELAAYLQALRAKTPTENILALTCTAQIVSKEKIAANGDYNLSGERYREGAASNHLFPLVFLGEGSLFRVESGGTPKSDVGEYWGGGIPWATLVDLPATDFISEITATKRTISDKGLRESSAKMIPANSVVVSTRATIGRIAINRVPIATNQGFKNVVIEDSARAVPEFVALALTKLVPTMQAWATGGTFAEISKSKFCELQIPLPPLEVQKEFVAEIEGYQKVINGARAVLDHYRPHVPIHPDWPMVELGEVCAIKSGGTPDRSSETYWNGDIPWVTTTLIDYGVIDRANEFITSEGLKNSATWVVPKGTVLMAMYGQGVTRGRVAILGIDAAVNQACAVFQLKGNTVDSGYLFRVLQSRYEDLRKVSEARGGNQSNLSAQVLKEYSIPLPPLATQQAIVAEIEAEQALVAANRELITRFEQKIQATLARIWGEDEKS
jgi:type I restriction enzyme M protein